MPPLTVTYLRAAAISMIVFSVYYGFAQWLQSAAGSWLTGGRTKGLRPAFLISIGAHLLAGDAACRHSIARRPQKDQRPGKERDLQVDSEDRSPAEGAGP